MSAKSARKGTPDLDPFRAHGPGRRISQVRRDCFGAVAARFWLALLVAAVLSGASEPLAAEPKFYTPPEALRGDWSFTPNPTLPNVLLVGDSIMVSYALGDFSMKGDVHFKPAATGRLAARVADAIRAVLQRRSSTPSEAP